MKRDELKEFKKILGEWFVPFFLAALLYQTAAGSLGIAVSGAVVLLWFSVMTIGAGMYLLVRGMVKDAKKVRTKRD